MKKRDRIKKETGWALAVSLPILALTFISLILSLGGKPQPTGSSAASKPTNRYASAVPGKKLSEPLASEVFDLAATRAAAAEESESPDEASSQAIRAVVVGGTSSARRSSKTVASSSRPRSRRN